MAHQLWLIFGLCISLSFFWEIFKVSNYRRLKCWPLKDLLKAALLNLMCAEKLYSALLISFLHLQIQCSDINVATFILAIRNRPKSFAEKKMLKEQVPLWTGIIWQEDFPNFPPCSENHCYTTNRWPVITTHFECAVCNIGNSVAK